MKKLFATLLTVAMLASMSVTAFAADNDTVTTDGGSKEISVNAKYVDGATTPGVISADIEWGAMEFTYSVGGVKVWDAQKHQYTVTNATNGWSENGNTVKVTNHSNVDVKTTFTYAAESGNTLTGAFTYDNSKTADSTGAVSLAKGVEGQVSTADYVTAALKLSGTPSSTMTDFTKVGTITVKITK